MNCSQCSVKLIKQNTFTPMVYCPKCENKYYTVFKDTTMNKCCDRCKEPFNRELDGMLIREFYYDVYMCKKCVDMTVKEMDEYDEAYEMARIDGFKDGTPTLEWSLAKFDFLKSIN